MSDDRRTFPRISESRRLRVREVTTDDSGDGGMTLNISGGGICFAHTSQLKPGAMLAMELDLPGYPAGVIALASVRWCEHRPGAEPGLDYEVGAAFHWIGWESAAAQEQVARYIRSKLGD